MVGLSVVLQYLSLSLYSFENGHSHAGGINVDLLFSFLLVRTHRRVLGMAFASVESSGGRKWSEGELRVEDEFTCSAALRGAVLALQATVKRVFDVELDISVEEGVEVHQTGLMWLQLKGKSGDVLAAKVRPAFRRS